MTAGRYRILVVDDEEPIVEIIESMISRLGHETLHAYSGEEAVAGCPILSRSLRKGGNHGPQNLGRGCPTLRAFRRVGTMQLAVTPFLR